MGRIIGIYRNAYGGLSRDSWWLSLVMFVNRAGTMVVPFLALYLTERRHFGITKVGEALAVVGLGAICGGIIGGRLTDRLGFGVIQVLSLGLGGVLFLVLGQLTTFAGICAGAFVLSVCNDAFRPANATAIAHYSREDNRTRSYSLNRLAINLGWALGGALGGWVASVNYQLLFWVDGCTNIAAMLLLLKVLPVTTKGVRKAAAAMAAGLPRQSPYADKPYLLFIGLTILFGCSFFQIFSTVPLFYRDVLRLSPFVIGNFMAFNGLLVVLLEMAVVYSLEQKKRDMLFIALGTLVVGVSFVAYNLLHLTVIVVALITIVFTFGEMLTMPFMNSFWIRRTNIENRGRYAGLYTVGWSSAQILAPYVGTQVVHYWGFGVLWWAVGCCTMATAAGFMWLKRM